VEVTVDGDLTYNPIAVDQAVYRCGVNESAKYQQCLSCAGGGTLVAMVMMDIQPAADLVSNMSTKISR